MHLLRTILLYRDNMAHLPELGLDRELVLVSWYDSFAHPNLLPVHDRLARPAVALRPRVAVRDGQTRHGKRHIRLLRVGLSPRMTLDSLLFEYLF